MKRLMILVTVAALSALLLGGAAHAATITGAQNNSDGSVTVTWALATGEYPMQLVDGTGKSLCYFSNYVNAVNPPETNCVASLLAPNTQYSVRLQSCVLTDFSPGISLGCDSVHPMWSPSITFTTARAGALLAPKPDYRWSNETEIENGLESHGIARGDFPRVLRRHLNIDSALCIGLRRYGTKLSDDGYTTTYKRFKCTLDASNSHIYAATVDWAGNVLTLKKLI